MHHVVLLIDGDISRRKSSSRWYSCPTVTTTGGRIQHRRFLLWSCCRLSLRRRPRRLEFRRCCVAARKAGHDRGFLKPSPDDADDSPSPSSSWSLMSLCSTAVSVVAVAFIVAGSSAVVAVDAVATSLGLRDRRHGFELCRCRRRLRHRRSRCQGLIPLLSVAVGGSVCSNQSTSSCCCISVVAR